jgi:serine/threonine-protein kinase
MPILRPSSSDFTSFVKAAAQYVAPGRTAKVSKSGGVSVALPGLGAIIRTSLVGALASPSTSALIMDGPTSSAGVVAVKVLLGIVSTLAGNASAAFGDGTGELASFSSPSGIAVNPLTGAIVVGDLANNRIRLVSPAGVVTTLAGSGSAAFADGQGVAASFKSPRGVAVIPSNGNIVVADSGNNRIRLISPTGFVSTLAGTGTAAYGDGPGATATFNDPQGVAVTSTGVIVVADTGNHRIRLVTQAGVVTTLAGNSTPTFADGFQTFARFNFPAGVAIIPSTNVIVVADLYNHRIRLITYPEGSVTTLAGNDNGTFVDGNGAVASFKFPRGVAVTSTGVIVVADTDNRRIRMITSAGVVTTLAGNGTAAFADGTGDAARFNGPAGVAVTSSGDIVVADLGNNRIRVIT